jgi:hypothetical protein
MTQDKVIDHRREEVILEEEIEWIETEEIEALLEIIEAVEEEEEEEIDLIHQESQKVPTTAEIATEMVEVVEQWSAEEEDLLKIEMKDLFQEVLQETIDHSLRMLQETDKEA